MTETEQQTQNSMVVTTVMNSDLLNRLNGESRRQAKSRSLIIRQYCEQGLKQAEGEQAKMNAG